LPRAAAGRRRAGLLAACPTRGREGLRFSLGFGGVDVFMITTGAAPPHNLVATPGQWLVEGAGNPAGAIMACCCLMLATALQAVVATPASASETHLDDRTEYRAPRAASAPVIDGVADEAVWATAPWQEIDELWLGPLYPPSDFQGRFRIVWTPDRIHVLVEIVDDILLDRYRDPLVQYWDDDCLEIFIDEDYSGGDHQYNHNAFGYHVSLDNQAVDLGTDGQPHNYSDHVESRWKQRGSTIVWELAIKVFADDYADDSADNRPVLLSAGKIMGIMLAYCDNDGSEFRENFIGSESVPFGKKDRGWIDAGLFGKLVLVAAP